MQPTISRDGYKCSIFYPYHHTDTASDQGDSIKAIFTLDHPEMKPFSQDFTVKHMILEGFQIEVNIYVCDDSNTFN